MGNRAIIIPEGTNVGVYLHWNGGIDSVTGFLEYCKLKGYRNFGGNNFDGYGMARFIQVVGNYFGGTTSIGIETNVYPCGECAKDLDNGIYVVKGWDIVSRIGNKCVKEGYDLQEMLVEIDSCQPEEEQLGEDFIKAEVVDVSDIKIGDKVFVSRYESKPELHTVVGIAPPNTYHNGDVSNLPYVDLYDHDGDYSWNGNNYLRGQVRRYRLAKNEDDNEISTFRMYADVKFNRPVDIKKDWVSPESYTMTMNGTSLNFDFYEYSGYVDSDDKTIIHMRCKNPDIMFEDLNKITRKSLNNVEKIEEFNLEIVSDDTDMELKPVTIEKLAFVIPSDKDEWEEFPVREEVLEKTKF